MSLDYVREVSLSNAYGAYEEIPFFGENEHRERILGYGHKDFKLVIE
jgi:hypothetical protein